MSEKIRIMIIDDDEDQQLIMKSYLEPRYEVSVASNGQDALEQLEAHQPQLFVVDLMMPKMNGHEFVEKLRALPNYKHTPVIMLSASTKREDIRAGYQKGASLYLYKPIEIEDVLRFIERETSKPGFGGKKE